MVFGFRLGYYNLGTKFSIINNDLTTSNLQKSIPVFFNPHFDTASNNLPKLGKLHEFVRREFKINMNFPHFSMRAKDVRVRWEGDGQTNLRLHVFG